MLRDIRNTYQKHKLEEADLPAQPIELFKRWLEEAISSEVDEPTAMTLSTVADGMPDSRIVLLKEMLDDRFIFFTNYSSSKSLQMKANPQVALNFFWPKLERQVRVKGIVSKVDEALSEAYFQSRPRESQLGAWASAQSQPVNGREELEQNFHKLETQFEGKIIPKPKHWGGFQIEAREIEFWQGRPGRLHDRIRYYGQQEGQWEFKRLSP